MTVAICQGCGRRASSEEIHCAACGRPLVEGDEAPPPGWMTAEVEPEPVVRPLTPQQTVADLSVEEEAALFIPTGTRRADAEQSAPATPPEFGVEATGERDETATSSLPGGHGWRVRVTAANAAHAQRDAAAGESVVRKPRGPRRFPRWIFPALVVAILSTSGAAALLIVMHVMHSG